MARERYVENYNSSERRIRGGGLVPQDQVVQDYGTQQGMQDQVRLEEARGDNTGRVRGQEPSVDYMTYLRMLAVQNNLRLIEASMEQMGDSNHNHQGGQEQAYSMPGSYQGELYFLEYANRRRLEQMSPDRRMREEARVDVNSQVVQVQAYPMPESYQGELDFLEYANGRRLEQMRYSNFGQRRSHQSYSNSVQYWEPGVRRREASDRQSYSYDPNRLENERSEDTGYDADWEVYDDSSAQEDR